MFEPETLKPSVPVSSGSCNTPLMLTNNCPDLAGLIASDDAVRANDVSVPLKVELMSSTTW
jgi:hypothetical protein